MSSLIQQLHPTGSDNNFSKLLYRTKCFSMLDLSLKALFFLYFPSPITFLECLLPSLPSALALFRFCFAKNEANKKFLLLAIIHHLLAYIIPLAILLIFSIFSLFAAARIGHTSDDYRSACTTTFDYDHNASIFEYRHATLKRVCRFTVPYEPFCYKGCSQKREQKVVKGPGGITFGYNYNSFGNAIQMRIDHDTYIWTSELNKYQTALTFMLIVAAIFAFFVFHFYQMVYLLYETGQGSKDGSGFFCDGGRWNGKGENASRGINYAK